MKAAGKALAQSVGAGKKKVQVNIHMPESSVGGVESPKEDPVDNYETRGHLETLIKAHGIKNDPAKMEKVHALAGRHKKAIEGLGEPPEIKGGKVKSMADLKQRANSFGAPKSDNDGDE